MYLICSDLCISTVSGNQISEGENVTGRSNQQSITNERNNKSDLTDKDHEKKKKHTQPVETVDLS